MRTTLPEASSRLYTELAGLDGEKNLYFFSYYFFCPNIHF